ncbi:MAG: hypothetical protein ACJA1M_001575, partial [Alphaproteobacteria bacterium]
NIDDLNNQSELDISKESTATMSTLKHVRRRTFKHPDLGDKIFEDHVKGFANNKRMHILPDYIKHTISIGYFGRHLSTVKYST